MNELQLELFNAAQKLNAETFEKFGEDAPIFSVTFADGYSFASVAMIGTNDVESVEMRLFNSENDNRSFDEAANEYEPMYDYLKQKYIEIIDNIIKYRNF